MNLTTPDLQALIAGCAISDEDGTISIHPYNQTDFDQLKGRFRDLAKLAVERECSTALLHPPDGSRPYEIPSYFAINSGSLNEPSVPQDAPAIVTSSYGASRISPNASYEAIEDFIRGRRLDGKIVTVMSMGTDRFLKVNELQIRERAGGWTMEDWVGTDAKNLWRRSLLGTLPGGANYYQRLIHLVTADHYIPEFVYLIDRPKNGGLWEDVTTYHYCHDYGGVAVRIAVSTPGQSRLVEAA
jgi:hypothetical protein